MRRVSLRRGSLRRGSLRRSSLVPVSNGQDLPWDILDRLLIPIICCHAAAIILSGILNVLHISDVSTLALFAWFALSTGGAILFYHHLKVSSRIKILMLSFCIQRANAHTHTQCLLSLPLYRTGRCKYLPSHHHWTRIATVTSPTIYMRWWCVVCAAVCLKNLRIEINYSARVYVCVCACVVIECVEYERTRLQAKCD